MNCIENSNNIVPRPVTRKLATTNLAAWRRVWVRSNELIIILDMYRDSSKLVLTSRLIAEYIFLETFQPRFLATGIPTADPYLFGWWQFCLLYFDSGVKKKCLVQGDAIAAVSTHAYLSSAGEEGAKAFREIHSSLTKMLKLFIKRILLHELVNNSC